MHTGLHARKSTMAVILPTLALSALFLAQGTMSLLALKLVPLRAPPALAPTRAAHSIDQPDPRAILARNIFDPSTGPLPRPRKPAPSPPLPREVSAVCGDASLRLVAAWQSAAKPDRSLVALTRAASGPLLFGEGARFGDSEVYSILPQSVVLRQRDGDYCSLALFGQATSAAPNAAHRKEPSQNVDALSETEYVVSRTFVERVMADPREIMRTRVVPQEQGGRVIGLRLVGIRRTGVLAEVGLRNGDVLRSINGFDLSSPDGALEAYSRLRSANHLSVALSRGGRDVTLEYELR